MPRAKKQHLKRRKDGRYCCKYHGIQFMGNTEDEALRARDEYKEAERRGELASLRPTSVTEYALKWLPLYKQGVSTKTYNDYAKQLDALVKTIGDMALDTVNVDDAAKVWEHYKGYSQSTVHRAKMLYVALFDAAIENDLCRKNPFRSKFAQPPRAPSGSHRRITDEEVNLIRNTPHRFQCAAMVMLYAGLRRGEVLALTKDDVNLKKGIIRVNKAVRFDSNQPIIDKPKTSSGVREVPILSPLRPLLTALDGRVAKSTDGKIMTDRAFRRAWDSYLHALSIAAGHPVSIRPHDLRHTYCTMCVSAGVELHQLMTWMGHADEKMILQVYDHVTAERTKKSIDLLEKSLNGMQNGMHQTT